MEQLFYSFSGLRWQDFFDIALNSYILFRFYVLFRGTNVIRVLLVVCVLWGVSRASVPMGLIITSWAMQGIIPIAAFVIIIVFRNEISSVFQTKDLKSFLWGIPRRQFNTPLNTIVDSVFDLAQKNIGALIVLPLKKGLETVVQGGVSLNGTLSKELLVSIFWPNNPMHDGAVVIEGDKITQAGVILPLSQRKDFPSLFGTRHRAALGVTEQTDALVIVVSEERGKVSLFKENQIYEIPDRLALESLLDKHALDDSPHKGFMHQGLELFFAGLIGLTFVTGIWMNFSKGMETLASYTVPIEFMMSEKNMEIVSSSVSNVDLLISGTRPLMNSVKTDQIEVQLDLSTSAAGLNHFSITKENILLPPGVRLKTIEPSMIDITLDTIVEKQLPVQPNWSGRLPEGLMMKDARAVPSTVRVIGGESVLSQVDTLFTEQILLDDLARSGSVETDLVLDPPSLKPLSSQAVRVVYTISTKAGQK